MISLDNWLMFLAVGIIAVFFLGSLVCCFLIVSDINGKKPKKKEASAFCPVCGYEAKAEYIICPRCGEKLNDEKGVNE